MRSGHNAPLASASWRGRLAVLGDSCVWGRCKGERPGRTDTGCAAHSSLQGRRSLSPVRGVQMAADGPCASASSRMAAPSGEVGDRGVDFGHGPQVGCPVGQGEGAGVGENEQHPREEGVPALPQWRPLQPPCRLAGWEMAWRWAAGRSRACSWAVVARRCCARAATIWWGRGSLGLGVNPRGRRRVSEPGPGPGAGVGDEVTGCSLWWWRRRAARRGVSARCGPQAICRPRPVGRPPAPDHGDEEVTSGRPGGDCHHPDHPTLRGLMDAGPVAVRAAAFVRTPELSAAALHRRQQAVGGRYSTSLAAGRGDQGTTATHRWLRSHR